MNVAALRELVQRMPDASVGQVLEEFARADPAIFCTLYRRLRQQSLTFDNSKSLAPKALAAAKKENPKLYDQHVRSQLLRHRPFLLQPLTDQHPHKAYEKARQVGVSELSLSELIHFLWSRSNTKAILTFPREKQLETFSNSRIKEAFLETKKMKSLLGVPNQTYTKKIGNSYLILRSAWESNLGEGVDADVVSLDEVDRMKPGVDVAFRESLKSSPYALFREISTPTLPGKGIDKSFRDSDQQVWHVRCTKCGLEQPIEYPDNVVQLKDVPLGAKELPENAYDFACKKTKCRGSLDRLRGRWIARYPERKLIRGYHIPQLIAPWITATGVMQDKIKYKLRQVWENYVLAMPTVGETVLISETDLDRACAGHQLITQRTSAWTDIAAGVDWGHENWLVVTGRNVHNNLHYVLFAAVFTDKAAEELVAAKMVERALEPFAPDIVVADAGYGKDRNAYLLRKLGKNRMWACYYSAASKGSRTFQPVWSAPESARLLVDRTMSLKLMCRAIREHEFGLPDLNIPIIQLFGKHLMNLTPVYKKDDEDDDDDAVVEHVENLGDDHLAHAMTYAYLGSLKLSNMSKFDFDFV